MSRSTWFVWIVTGLLSVLMTSQAQAIRVTRNGAVIFQDTFENGMVGENFGPADGLASWSFRTNGNSSALVTDAAAPAPAQGTKYGEVSRPLGQPSAQANGEFNVPIEEGDQLYVELMVWIPSGQPNFGFYCGFEDEFESRYVGMGINELGQVTANNGVNGAWIDTGLDVTYNTWQKWTQDWVVGATTKTITVGGNSVILNDADLGGNPISDFFVSTVGGSHYYVDAVPTTLAGDYNQNGHVDAADYTVWRDTLGAMGTGLAADGDGNRKIEQADYGVWKSNFGLPGAASGWGASSLASVPEPASCTLVLLSVLAIATTRGRRRLQDDEAQSFLLREPACKS